MPPRVVDIGVNLTDPVFRGIYRGKQRHADDLAAVLGRAWECGMARMIVTGGSLEESRQAAELCAADPERLFFTVGCHPTRCDEFDTCQETNGNADEYLAALLATAKGNAVAIGECGLDYDREQFCSRAVQQRYFKRQFELARATRLPMFLHSRAAGADFARIVRENRGDMTAGVVHSFTGTLDEARELTDDLDLYIGVNGCSLKTPESLDVVRQLPLERLLLETDAPWCGMRPTHASAALLPSEKPGVRPNFPTVKPERFVAGAMTAGRNEPCHIVSVLAAVAALHGVSAEECASVVYRNTMRVFWP